MTGIQGKFQKYQVSYVRDPSRKEVFVCDSLSTLVNAYNKLKRQTTIARSGIYYSLSHGGHYKGLEVGRASTDGFRSRPGEAMYLINSML